MNRRRFVLTSSMAVGGLVVATSCKKDDPDNNAQDVDLGSGDVGILNYAYALEQLEAEFYMRVTANFFSGATQFEQTLLSDIRDHEITHRDFFKAAIGGAAIRNLTFDFSSVDFNSRASVLGTAKALEDTGVGAYNGAGPKLVSPEYLTLAGKIVSVEARHAAAIRYLLAPNTADFAGNDIVNPANGLEYHKTYAQTLTAADPFIVNKINFSNLPA